MKVGVCAGRRGGQLAQAVLDAAGEHGDVRGTVVVAGDADGYLSAVGEDRHADPQPRRYRDVRTDLLQPATERIERVPRLGTSVVTVTTERCARCAARRTGTPPEGTAPAQRATAAAPASASCRVRSRLISSRERSGDHPGEAAEAARADDQHRRRGRTIEIRPRELSGTSLCWPIPLN